MTGAPIQSVLWNSTMADLRVFDLLPPDYHPALCRMQGTMPPMQTDLVHRSFHTRFRARWDGEEPTHAAAASYDAHYMLAYALAAASSDANPYPSGPEIAAAMARLSEGAPIEAGPEQWNTGIVALRSAPDATIDYVGVSGEVDFRPDTGTIDSEVEAFRLNVERQELESLGIILDRTDVYTPPDFSAVVDYTCGPDIRP